jgi:CHAT domain-containing protein
VAYYCPAWDGELQGIALVDAARSVDKLLAKENHDALEYWQAALWTNQAINYLQANDAATALQSYVQALEKTVGLRLKQLADDLLLRIGDLLSAGDVGRLKETILSLGRIAVDLEYSFSPKTVELLQVVYRNLMTIALDHHQEGPAIVPILMQLAKGFKFARMIACGTSALHNLDAAGNMALRRILSQEDLIYQDLSGSAPLDEVVLATPYQDAAPSDGSVSRGGLGDVRRSAELQLARFMTDAMRTAGQNSWFSPPLYSVPDIQELLDSRSVLLEYFISKTSDGRLAVCAVLTTNTFSTVAQITHNYPDRWPFDPRRSTMGELVAMIREGVEKEPSRGTRVDAKTNRLLEELRSGFLGPFETILKDLRAQGKDHLCIVPHQETHYLPFHLLGDEEASLGTEWLVTYLPNLALLAATRKRPRSMYPIGSDVIVYSVDYGSDPDWPELPEVRVAAGAIASKFGVLPVLNSAVTCEGILNALTTTRYAHVFAHGRHIVDAPSFQFIPLMAERGRKARLSATDVLRRDMRNLELLTLGACETSLGRFDSVDNLRGLPAAFFMAGVGAIVGTLWSVEVNTCVDFFSALYGELAEGRGPLDAFGLAQKTTRLSHPAHRDWGAFTFIGNTVPSSSNSKTIPGMPNFQFFNH